MQAYIMQRLLMTIPVMFVVLLFTFTLLRVTPGDPARIIAGVEATEEEIAEIRHSLGLDRPLPMQLAIFLGDILRGDLGTSITSHFKVTRLIRSRILPTASLAFFTELFAISMAVPLGVLAAWKANTWIDRSVMIFCSLGFSIPLFFLGFLLIIGFALKWQLFPVAGFVHPSEGILTYLRHLVLPSLATGLVIMALIARMTRASMLEVLQEDYIRTAQAKGLSETTVLLSHALKNAALPIVTIIGLGCAGVLGGLVITEYVFAIPGMGRLVVDAMLRRDYPVIQGAILLISAVYVLVNLVVDLSYAYFDPRIKY